MYIVIYKYMYNKKFSTPLPAMVLFYLSTFSPTPSAFIFVISILTGVRYHLLVALSCTFLIMSDIGYPDTLCDAHASCIACGLNDLLRI